MTHELRQKKEWRMKLTFLVADAEQINHLPITAFLQQDYTLMGC
jgi:hypothetical protein